MPFCAAACRGGAGWRRRHAQRRRCGPRCCCLLAGLCARMYRHLRVCIERKVARTDRLQCGSHHDTVRWQMRRKPKSAIFLHSQRNTCLAEMMVPARQQQQQQAPVGEHGQRRVALRHAGPAAQAVAQQTNVVRVSTFPWSFNGWGTRRQGTFNQKPAHCGGTVRHGAPSQISALPSSAPRSPSRQAC